MTIGVAYYRLLQEPNGRSCKGQQQREEEGLVGNRFLSFWLGYIDLWLPLWSFVSLFLIAVLKASDMLSSQHIVYFIQTIGCVYICKNKHTQTIFCCWDSPSILSV